MIVLPALKVKMICDVAKIMTKLCPPLGSFLRMPLNVRMGFKALITATVLYARYQNSLVSVSGRRVHVVFSSVGIKGGGKPYPKARETAALWRSIQTATHTQLR